MTTSNPTPAIPVTEVRQTTALARLDPQALIAAAIDKGAGIDTLERLVALAERVRIVQAKEAYYAAMAAFQQECPSIKKTARAKIKTARAEYSYSYAPLGDIMPIVLPVLGKHGLSVSWKTPRFEQGERPDQTAVVISCVVTHELGHQEDSGEIRLPISLAEPERGANPSQRVGMALTYAKRYALLGVLGLAPEDDDDAASTGGGHDDGDSERSEGERPTTNGGNGGTVITEPQVRRFHAIANDCKWTGEQIHDLLASFKYGSSKEISVKDYDRIIQKLKAGPGA